MLADGVDLVDGRPTGQQRLGHPLESGEVDALGRGRHERAAAAGDDGQHQIVGGGRARHVEHRPRALDAALQLSPVDGPVEPGDFNHVALEVEDVDATVADLDDALVGQGPETIPEFGLRVAFVEDPDGYGIELIEEL